MFTEQNLFRSQVLSVLGTLGVHVSGDSVGLVCLHEAASLSSPQMLVVDGDSGSEVWSVSVPCHLRETPTTSAMTSDKKSVFLFWAQALPTAVSELKARAGSVVVSHAWAEQSRS